MSKKKPTVLMILDGYGPVSYTHLDVYKRQALDTINDAFDKLLDSLYEDDRMKIQTDIAVLKTLLSQEGLVDDGLHM